MTAGYYRFPTIYQDTIVFVAEDDLWSVAVQGGMPRRLTSNLGEVTHPIFSPDGAWIAFVGRDEGAPEIYVMPAEGGPARRLTYLSSNSWPVGWMFNQTEIIFCSNYGQKVDSEYALFTIPSTAQNGVVTPLAYGPAQSLALGPAGQVVIGRNTQDPARWKRYRGGTAGHFWIDRTGDGQFSRFLDTLQGNIASPMWIHLAGQPERSADRIFFISDHEGIGNLYSCLSDSADLRRHTDHEDYYVRNPNSDGARIVYHAGADIYVYDVAADKAERVDMRYYSPRIQRNRKFVDAATYLDTVRPHPRGRALALTTRGKAFAFYNHEGPVLQYGQRDGVRYRLPEWLADERRLLLISDATGEEVIEIHEADPDVPPKRLEGLDLGRAVSLKLSPVEDKLALTNHRHELFVIDLNSGELILVDRSPYRLISGFDWSPDGRWLAYGHSATTTTTAIRLYRLPDPKAEDETLQPAATYTITHPILHDVSPAFDPDGKYLYFLSYREFNPVYDGLHFELGFPWGMRPYLITLQADAPNPFIPIPDWDGDDENKGEEGPSEDADTSSSEAAESVLSMDADEGDEEEMDETEGKEDEAGENEDAISNSDKAAVSRQRKHNLFQQLSQSRPRHVNLKENGKEGHAKPPATSAQQSTAAPAGADKASRPPERLQIDLEGIERRVLPFPVPDGRYGQILGISDKALFTTFPVHGALDFENAHDDDAAEVGLLRSYNFKEYRTDTVVDNVSWFTLSRNRKRLFYGSEHRLRVLNAGEKPQSDSGPARKTGWIDLRRVKVSVDPQREWEQMFREAWRLQRDHFWTEDMAEVDWQTVYQRYFPLIDRVNTRSEFSDLMWEMQGELGTSHAYEYGGDYRPRPYYGQGFLGGTFHWDEEGKGYHVDELIVGDPWDTENNSALAAPGIDVQPGDLLLAINGQRLTKEIGPAHLLVNQAGQEVLITFAQRPSTAESTKPVVEEKPAAEAPQLATVGEADIEQTVVTQENDTPASIDTPAAPAPANTIPAIAAPPPSALLRSFVVKAIYTEARARYRAWVEANRRYVHATTGGRVGYVHVPDMGAKGYAEFHRSYLAEVARDALIIDVRYNGGGNVSQLILEKLARRRIGYDLSRWGGLSPYPSDSVAGPIVALTNEHAGSDGDIFCHSFKLLQLGPLIGKRTWGGVVGISPTHTLVDGTVTTQPEYSFWFTDVGWNVENYGTDPDIEVDITPQDYRNGIDPQLERAVHEIERLFAERPVIKPDLASRPSRALPKLPPRNHVTINNSSD